MFRYQGGPCDGATCAGDEVPGHEAAIQAVGRTMEIPSSHVFVRAGVPVIALYRVTSVGAGYMNGVTFYAKFHGYTSS